MAFLRLFARTGLRYRNNYSTRVVTVIPNIRAYCNEKLAIKSEQKHDWNRAVSEAEKIVGFVSTLHVKFLATFIFIY